MYVVLKATFSKKIPQSDPLSILTIFTINFDKSLIYTSKKYAFPSIRFEKQLFQLQLAKQLRNESLYEIQPLPMSFFCNTLGIRAD
jgi:hypothetical protein